MPYMSPYLDATGMHIPTYEERMDYLIAGYKQIFGADVYLEPDSKDYQLLSLFARAADDLTASITASYNAHDPNLASGNALDLLLPLNGIRRLNATYGTVTLELTGAPGATLPSGMQARDEQGYLWRISGAVTLGSDGRATADATCLTAGAILAPAGTITQIHTPTSTWNTVTNPAASVPGRDVETDAAVRERRSLSVSLPSRSILSGIRAALANLTGVQSVSVLENDTAQENTDGLPAHSICAVVEGGGDAAIARVLWLKKSPGVATFGTSTAIYTDEWGGDNTMRFTRPTTVLVSVSARLKKLPGWDGSTESTLQKAIADYINGLDIGESLVVSTLYGVAFGAFSGASPAFSITALTASTAEQTATSDTITAAYSQRLSGSASAVSIEVVN